MTTAVPDILARIVERKRAEISDLRLQLDVFEAKTAARRDFRDFARAIGSAPAIIAEIKKASPSRGVLAAEFHPASIARAYEQGGAAALSVLTDREFFQGSLDDLETARRASGLPVLRKDFVLDPVQILQSAAHGADAILLIATILPDLELASFRKAAEDLGVAAVVEIHNELELDRAIDSGAGIIGVNNRDLRTFTVSLETSLRLAERLPSNVVRVSESGIRSRADVDRLRRAGYHAFLVGENLMTAAGPEQAVRELLA
jgi:indole-3-glycerol phosphate synthase